MNARIKLLLVIGVFAALAFAVWYGIRGFASDEVRKFLAERDIPVASLTIETLTPSMIVLKDVAIGEGSAVKAKSVTITRLSGTSIDTMQVQLDASGISINGKNTPKGWSFGGVERLFPSENKPASTKEISPASVAISDANLQAKGALAGDIAATLRAKRMAYTTDTDTLLLDGIVLKPDLASAKRLVTVPFTVDSASFSNIDGAVFTPLALKGTMRYALDAGNLKGDFSGVDATKKFRMNGTVDHMVATGKGTVSIATNDVALGSSEGRLKLTDLLPMMDASRPTPTMRGKLQSTIALGKEGYESVKGTLDVFSLDSGALLQDALKGHGTLDGLLKASLPFTITPKGWKILDGHVLNDGPMKLALLKDDKKDIVSGIAGLLGKSVPEGALDGVNISVLDLQALSTNEEGDIVLKGKLKGNNPMIRKDVIINVNISTNLMDMLRSLSVTTEAQ